MPFHMHPQTFFVGVAVGVALSYIGFRVYRWIMFGRSDR